MREHNKFERTTKMKQSVSKKTAKKNEKVKNKQKKNTPNPERSKQLIHQIIPYILSVVAIFFAICFLFVNLFNKPESMGFIGKILTNLLLGLFGFGAFLIPLLLMYLALVWRKSINFGQTGYKIFFSCACIVLVSSLIHVCVLAGGAEETLNPIKLWRSGCSITGGGLVGGFIGQLSFYGLDFVGSLIVIIAILAVTLMFLFGLTPDNIIVYIKYKAKLRAEKREQISGDPVFIDKPRFTAKDLETTDETDKPARRKKRTFDVDIESQRVGTTEQFALEHCRF